MMDPRLLERLACPRCREPLDAAADGNWLLCRKDGIAFPVTDGIARLVEEAARPAGEVAALSPPD